MGTHVAVASIASSLADLAPYDPYLSVFISERLRNLAAGFGVLVGESSPRQHRAHTCPRAHLMDDRREPAPQKMQTFPQLGQPMAQQTEEDASLSGSEVRASNLEERFANWGTD